MYASEFTITLCNKHSITLRRIYQRGEYESYSS